MDRYIILADAAYFFTAGGTALSADGSKVRRSDLALKDPANLLRQMREIWDAPCAPAPLLRMHWYDAPPRGMAPSTEQEFLGRMPGIKLRLGNLNGQGEQKGVDSLIITDLIDLARNMAVCDVVLVAGDEDLRVGVSVAQGYGVRVHLMGIGDVIHNTSPRLLMESDGQIVVGRPWLERTLEIRQAIPAPAVIPPPEPAPVEAPPMSEGTAIPPGDVRETALEVIAEILANRTSAELDALKTSLSTPKSAIPPEYDGKLLATVGRIVSRRLNVDESSVVRQLFRRAVNCPS